MSMTAWLVLGSLALVVAWAVAVYNRLVTLRNRIANAYGQIDVQLKRRYDLVPNLVEVARGYLQHEAATLQAVIQARGQAQGAADAARAAPSAAHLGALAAAEGALGAGLGRLLAVAESYPELKADAAMRQLSEELASTENRLGFARQAYNDSVLDYNNAVVQFPSTVVARLFGFVLLPMLESIQRPEERDAPRVNFSGSSV